MYYRFRLLFAILLFKESRSLLSNNGCKRSNYSGCRYARGKFRLPAMEKVSENTDLFGGTRSSENIVEEDKETVEDSSKIQTQQPLPPKKRIVINIEQMEEELKRTNARKEPGKLRSTCFVRSLFSVTILSFIHICASLCDLFLCRIV